MWSLITTYNKDKFNWNGRNKTVHTTIVKLLECVDDKQLNKFQCQLLLKTLPFMVEINHKERKKYTYYKQQGTKHIWKLRDGDIKLIVDIGTDYPFFIVKPKSLK